MARIGLKITKTYEDGITEEIVKGTKKYKAQVEYAKRALKKVGVDIKKEDADKFTAACKKMNITKAEVLKKAIYDTIEKAK